MIEATIPLAAFQHPVMTRPDMSRAKLILLPHSKTRARLWARCRLLTNASHVNSVAAIPQNPKNEQKAAWARSRETTASPAYLRKPVSTAKILNTSKHYTTCPKKLEYQLFEPYKPSKFANTNLKALDSNLVPMEPRHPDLNLLSLNLSIY